MVLLVNLLVEERLVKIQPQSNRTHHRYVQLVARLSKL